MVTGPTPQSWPECLVSQQQTVARPLCPADNQSADLWEQGKRHYGSERATRSPRRRIRHPAPSPGLPDTTLSPPHNRASTPSRGWEQSWHHPPIPQWYRLRLGAKSAAGHAANHCVPACSGHRPRPQPAAKQPQDPGRAIQGFYSASESEGWLCRLLPPHTAWDTLCTPLQPGHRPSRPAGDESQAGSAQGPLTHLGQPPTGSRCSLGLRSAPPGPLLRLLIGTTAKMKPFWTKLPTVCLAGSWHSQERKTGAGAGSAPPSPLPGTPRQKHLVDCPQVQVGHRVRSIPGLPAPVHGSPF